MEFYYGALNNNGCIYHYGIPEKSGRFRWGSGDRPYQRLEGDRNSKRKSHKKDVDTKMIVSVEKKNTISNTKSSTLQNAQKDNKIRDKANSINNPYKKMRYMLRHSDQYTTKELQQVTAKYQAETMLAQQASAYKRARITKVREIIQTAKDIGDNINKINSVCIAGVSAYNTVAKIYNGYHSSSIKKGERSSLNIIEGFGNMNKQKKKR